MLINAPLVDLMQIYASDTLNFQHRFKGDLLTTLVLSMRASATFCLATNALNEYILGVHPAVFKRLHQAKVKCIYFLGNKPGFFISIIGDVDRSREFCFKVQARASTTALLRAKSELHFQSFQMGHDIDRPILSGTRFPVKTIPVDKMIWEPKHQLTKKTIRNHSNE